MSVIDKLNVRRVIKEKEIFAIAPSICFDHLNNFERRAIHLHFLKVKNMMCKTPRLRSKSSDYRI